jgi:hypothetical protein
VTYEVWNIGSGCVPIIWGASTTCEWAFIVDQSEADKPLPAQERSWFTVGYRHNNNRCDVRECAIQVTARIEGDSITSTEKTTLTQDFGGLPVLELDQNVVAVTSTAGVFRFNVKNTGCGTLDWSITADCDWVTLLNPSGSVAEGSSSEVAVAYTTNTSCESRTCRLTVRSPGLGTKVLVVNQQFGGIPRLTTTVATGDLGTSAGWTTFVVKNSGCGVLNWSAAVPCSWMRLLSPASGSLNPGVEALVSVAYDTNTDADARTCTIIVTAPGATGSPKAVTFTQRGTARAALAITPTSAQGGANAGTATTTIQNTGNAPMAWSAATSCDWATVSPASGTVAPGASASLAVNYSENQGTQSRTCSVTVSAPFTTGSPKSFTLTQAPHQQGVLSVTPASRSVASGAVTAVYTLANSGTAAMPWSAATTSGWVTGISPASGTLQPGAQATVSVSVAENPSATGRSTTLTFTAPSALGSPATASLLQAGNTNPALTVTPATLDVGSEAGSKTFSVANTGGGTLTWSVTAECGWVRGISPSSGVLQANQNVPVTVIFDANTAAKRECTLRVTATGVADSPKLVTLSQSAESGPVLTLEPATLVLDAEAGAASFTVRNTGDKNLAWNALAACDWVTIVSANSGNLVPGASALVTINYTANASTLARNCAITIEAEGAQGSPGTVSVSQAGTELPGCCMFNKSVGSDLGEQLKRYLGDLLLMGLSLFAVLALARMRRA